MEKSLADLPPVVLTEILSSLPFRTLSASKCVCKTFLHLSSPDNPQFMKMHSTNANQILMFQFKDHLEWFGSKPSVFTFDPEMDAIATDDSSQNDPKLVNNLYELKHCNGYALVNSCNGLILLVGEREAVICNPVTNEHFKIPATYTEGLNSIWLGFCPSSKKYKVLNFISRAEAGVLEIGSNSSWKYIVNECPFYNRLHNNNHVFLNGVMYWVCYFSSNMVFFDFERERFGVIGFPQDKGVSISCNCIRVGILRGSLCLSMVYSSRKIVILVLNQGNQNKWNIKYVIDIPDHLMKGSQFYSAPLLIFRDVEIVFLCGDRELIFYNVENKSFRSVLLGDEEIESDMFDHIQALSCNLRNLVVLTPSIVSLKDTLMVEDDILKKSSIGWKKILVPTFYIPPTSIHMSYTDLVCYFWPQVKINIEKSEKEWTAIAESLDRLES